MMRWFRVKQKQNAVPQNEFLKWFYSQNLIQDQGSVFIDVGAHIGQTSSQILKYFPNGIIYIIEPFSGSFEKLKNRFATDRNVHCHQLALSNREGNGFLHINNSTETNSLLPSCSCDAELNWLTNTMYKEKVNTTTLDSFSLQHNIRGIDLLKIDAQGLTFEILEGSKGLLMSKLIRFIYAEVEFIEIYRAEKRFSEIELMLRSNGYYFKRFFNCNYTTDGRLAWADALFVADRAL